MKKVFTKKLFNTASFKRVLPLLMVLFCLFAGTGKLWAVTTYGKVNASAVGEGYVNVGKAKPPTATSPTASVTLEGSKSLSSGRISYTSVSAHFFAVPKDGYYFKGWFTDQACTTSKNANAYWYEKFTPKGRQWNPTDLGKFYAQFLPVEINAADPTTKAIDAQYSKKIYTGSVSFETKYADAMADFETPVFENEVGNGKYTMERWSYANNKVIVEYSFTGNGEDGTTTAKLVLKSAGKVNVNSKTVSFTATSYLPNITSGDAGKQLTPSTPTAVAKGTATFNVTNAEDASYFTPAFSNVQGGGTWKITSTSYNAGVYTVNYTFQSDAKHLGNHSADLTLTATVGSATMKVTATAFTEAVADYDVEVFNKSGVSIHQGDWATAVTKANANEGSTIKLCRNIDLGVLSTHGANITVNTTLDLAGKTLSATCNAKDRYTIYLTKAKTLTITDSKNGGTIRTTGSYNGVIYCVGASAGSIIMNGGTISHENTMTYASGSSVQTRAVQIAANANFTLNDGEIIAEGGNQVFGVRQEGSATATGEVHINGGTINANCKRQYAYGIYTLGKLYVDGGTINAKTYTSSGTSEAYGIYVSASANQTDANEYGGHLSISESSTVVINAQSQTSGAYAISVAGAYTCAKVDGAYTHTTARAYPASAEIHAGTFNAYSTTSGAYGLRVICSVKSVDETLSETVVKPTIVYGGTFNATAHTSSAFGIRADAVTSGAYGALERSVVEIYDANATAIAETGTDAYGAYVASAAGDYAKLHTENGDPGTKGGSYSGHLDGGCYVVASKMTIHGGTFTGISAKTTAAGVYCQTRAIAADAVYDVEKGDYNRVAYPNLTIDKGTFVGKTEGASATKTAYGLYSGGITTVNGGTFTALTKTTTAYAVMVNAGKATISNATLTATATSSAYGVYVNAGVAGTTGFCTFGEATLNNLNVTATTTTDNEAYGVRIVTAQNTIPEAAKWNCHPGEYVCAGKATINGGSYNVTAAGTTAYGVCLNNSAPTILGNKVATGEAHMKDASFVVKTKGTTTAYGVHAGGKTTIDNCTFNVAAQTTTAYGIYAQDKECSVKNSTFTVNAGGNNAYGIYANASLLGYMRIPFESRVVSSNNKFTVVSGGTPAYGVYAHSTKMVQNATTWAALSDANKTTYPYPEKYAYGEWAVAAEVSLENDEIDVTAVGATARTIYTRGNCKPTETSEVSAMAKVTIDGGKYKATAATTQQDVFNETPKASDGYYAPEDGEPILIKGGFFKNDANLDFYKAPGLYVNDLESGVDAEYAEGYRYEVGAPRFGTSVCKNVNANKEYLTLEAALEDVNNGTVNGGTIVMMLPYTLPAGNYKIPNNTTLLVPYSKDQTAANGTQMGKTTGYLWNQKYPNLKYGSSATHEPQYQNVLLTIANGAHIDVYGIVEASALMWAKTANAAGSAVIWGGYGQIQMDEGSSMSIESGAKLQAWGYITGKGEITVHRGAAVYEMFQTFDWKGGSNLSNYFSDMQSHQVFPVNQYYIQNIESPVIYRPGSHLRASMYVDLSGSPTGCDDIGLIGEWRSSSSKDIAMFLMDAADMSDDTWVRKEYDPINDVQLYTINSAAMVSSVEITASGQTLNSQKFDLPLTNNFKIRVQNGKLDITENVVMLPGAEIEIMKEASLDINSGKRLILYDKDQWNKYAFSGAYIKPLVYSPSWKTCPRSNLSSQVKDASINVRASGKIVVNGALYTTNSGANIHSSNEEAGHVLFPASSAAANASVYQWWQLGGNDGKTTECAAATITSAQLKNEDGTFTSTVGANNGKTYAYSEGRWQCWEQVGCYQVDKSDDANWKWYANPSDFVQIKPNKSNNHAAPTMDEDHLYPNTDETRFFILIEDDCIWWEVSLVDDELCYSEMNDTYYQWDGSKWVIKSFVITWKDWNGTTLDTYSNAKYKSMPKWLSATPTKAKQAGDPDGSYYIFSGWTPDLDIVTENATYTATYELIVPKYDVLWQNEDGSKTLHISRWAEGEHPAYDGAEIKKATSMVGVDLAHNGWSTAANGAGTRYGLTDELPAMGTAAQTYYATFAEGSIITWKNEDGTVLDRKLWAAGTRPTHANINKESDAQYDYVFAGWTPEVLPVEADADYTAVFTPVLRQYAITFSNLNGKGSSQVVNVNYGATPVCPVTPDRGNSAEYSYEWTGWKDGAGNTFGTDYVFPVVSGDATYTATFSQTTRTYTVTWKNEDGSVLERVRGLAVGDAVPDYSGATPEKEPTRYLVYGFTGWTPAKKATVDESGDQEYRATYDAGSTRYYTVSWLMDNDDHIDETHLEYDEMPTHADPYKASNALYSYDFAGWTPAISAVKGDAEYKATFNAIHRQYEITYVLYDDVKNVVRYEAEAAVATPATPTREGYTFVRWDKEIPATMPAEDVEITAIWTPITYNITYNGNGLDGGSTASSSHTYDVTKALTTNGFTKTGYSFNGWNTAADGSGTSYTDGQSVTNLTTTNGATITLYAQWTPAETGDYLDIVDWTDSSLTINTNALAASGWPYTINDVEYQKTARLEDRTLIIPYTGSADGVLDITVNNKNSETVSKRSYTIPHIYDTNANLSGVDENSIVYIHSGAIVTVAANTNVKAIYVAPNADLVVSNGVTLTLADKLVLRTTPWAAAALDNRGTISGGQVYYSYIIANKDQQYYQFAIPLASNTYNVKTSDDIVNNRATEYPYNTAWLMKYYSESSRANNGATGKNWVALAPGTISGTVGYELFSMSKYYREYYFPITLPNTQATTVTVQYTNGSNAADNGWNAVCSPLTKEFRQVFANPSKAVKVSELMEDGRYYQHIPTTIRPSVPFYYQASQGQMKLVFGSEMTASAPYRAIDNEEVATEWLQVNYSDAQGRSDETNIFLHPTDFVAEYENGLDVAKLSTTGARPFLYTSLACGDLAFAALPDEAAQRIPLTVYSPANGEYTFSLTDNDYMDRMDAVYLVDEQTGIYTNLLSGDTYSAAVEQGTTTGRFYLMAEFAPAPGVATGMDEAEGAESVTIEKVFIDGLFYIRRGGELYDWNGRLVK